MKAVKYRGKFYFQWQAEAQSEVRKAVGRGDLLPAKMYSCVDCGKAAKDWDHSDYTKPLLVEAVCRSCNLTRGCAFPHPKFKKNLRRQRRYNPALTPKSDAIDCAAVTLMGAA